MSDQDAEFVRALAGEFPAINVLLEEHLKDNHGELLPYVFMGTVTFYLVSLLTAARRDATDSSELHRVLSRLEQDYSQAPAGVRNLIAVSFLENLPHEGQAGIEIRDMIGPQLRATLDEMGI